MQYQTAAVLGLGLWGMVWSAFNLHFARTWSATGDGGVVQFPGRLSRFSRPGGARWSVILCRRKRMLELRLILMDIWKTILILGRIGINFNPVVLEFKLLLMELFLTI